MLVEHYNLVCEGKNSTIWIAVIVVYALVLQFVAVYLAFRTRKVKIKALNDAKYLAFIIYSTTVILTGMIIGTVSLNDFLNTDAAVFSAGLLFFTTSILGLLFVPKVFHFLCVVCDVLTCLLCEYNALCKTIRYKLVLCIWSVERN